MRDKLLEVIAKKVDGEVTAAKVLDFLIAEGAVTNKRMRRCVVRHEFFRIMEAPEIRTALDIEQELSVRFGVSVRAVQAMRSEVRRNKSK